MVPVGFWVGFPLGWWEALHWRAELGNSRLPLAFSQQGFLKGPAGWAGRNFPGFR